MIVTTLFVGSSPRAVFQQRDGTVPFLSSARADRGKQCVSRSALEPRSESVRRRDMIGPTRRTSNVAVLIAAVLATGCGSAASTQQAHDEQPSSTSFSVYTHCGVENVRIDGRWWHASPPLYNEERSGPPGWVG